MDNNFIKEKKIWGGCNPTPSKKKKFSFGGVIGYIDPATLPDKFSLGEPIEIKNQNIPAPSWVCVAESLCAVSEYQEGVALEPAFTCKLISEILGNTRWIFGGTDLATGAKAALRGFLTRQDAPHSIEKEGVAYCAEPSNWPVPYDEMAFRHAKQDYYWIGVSKKLSFFDAIRCAMYQFRNEKRAVQGGIIWNAGWENQTDIVKEEISAGGHAICYQGWDGDYLLLQNSIGKEVGNNGIQRIHKDIINKNSQFEALMFLDRPEGLTDNQIKEKSKYYRANWIIKIWLLLVRHFSEIMK